jgi:hypothetical protein
MLQESPVFYQKQYDIDGALLQCYRSAENCDIASNCDTPQISDTQQFPVFFDVHATE